MDLDNPIETIMHHLLIGGIACLDRQDGFPMVSALLYVMHNNKTYSESGRKAINCHDSPSYYTIWTLNLGRILNLCQNQ